MLGLIIAVFGFYLLGLKYLDWQEKRFGLEQTWEKTKFELQLKAKCQELAATHTDPKWGYKSCAKELVPEKPKTQTL